MRPTRTAFALIAALGLTPAAACHGQDQSQAQAGSADQPALAPPGSAARDKAFLAQNAKAPGVVVLPSGLQYKVVHSGPANGAHPQPGDELKVNYEGKLVSGEVFDSTFQRGEPAVMPLAGLVPGWMEALPLMRPGDEWVLYVPPELGYGDRGAGGVIPPGAVLIFRLQLLGVLPNAGSAAG